MNANLPPQGEFKFSTMERPYHKAITGLSAASPTYLVKGLGAYKKMPKPVKHVWFFKSPSYYGFILEIPLKLGEKRVQPTKQAPAYAVKMQTNT